MSVSVYEPIRCQREFPSAAMDSRRNTLTGVLKIENGNAEFCSGNKTIQIKPVLSVQKARRGSDSISRWIEVQYGDPEHAFTVYLNDGGWRGWRPILARTNRRIAADLSAELHRRNRHGGR